MDQSNEIPVVNQVAETVPISPQVTEKMVPQSKVDEIVKYAKYDSAQKARAEAVEEYKRSQAPSSSAAPVSMGGITQDQVRDIFAQEAQRYNQSMYEQNQAADANRIAYEFHSKLDAAKSKYPDFQETVGGLPFSTIAPVVSLANEMENTADIMYELAKNPLKMANIHSLAQLNPENPSLARVEIKRLSDSINVNLQAKNAKLPNQPLTQIKSSPVDVDNGSMTVKDYRKFLKSKR